MVKSDELRMVGSQPQGDNSVQAWLATSLNSSWSKQGERVEAVISRPLLSPDHKLLLPEGTRLIGEVTMVQRARWFHRGGQLRFNFQNVALPQGIDRPSGSEGRTTFKTLAILDGAEPDGKTSLRVDEEGGVKATEPKTRFVAPLVALFIASRAADNDVNKVTGQPESNTGGHMLGGASGFGLLGVAAAKASPEVAKALGYYGLAWSVFRNVVARGKEVEFQKNAPIDVRFGARVPPGGSKFRALH
jgi:hypothetical protein